MPQGRSLAFDETRPGELDPVTIKLPEPATVRVTIDRSQFPQAKIVYLVPQRGGWDDYRIKLNNDQSTSEFNSLPAGDYLVVVDSKLVQYWTYGNGLEEDSRLADERIRLNEGEIKEVRFAAPNVQKP